VKNSIRASVAAGVLLTLTASVQSVSAADLTGQKIAVRGHAPRPTMVELREGGLAPFCTEMPEWLLPGPPMLRCVPPYYFQPRSPELLNAVKAVARPPRPYPVISRY
jgi:hypothetical protein